ncbi:MAG: glutamate synthase-related protein, partial [Alphaproteobacteria bacterium]|nr:glutamate synthase-related protein [Alphaproteobacteria bacterium]
AALMEPWDGPAAVAFTDGRQIGATLDRNGLRPARYLVTTDGLVVMASEVGVLDIPPERIARQWRLQPGKMFLIDLEQQRIVDDGELKAELARSQPYGQWLARTRSRLNDLEAPPPVASNRPAAGELLDRQQAFGYTNEDLEVFLQPMGEGGDDPVGSMGTDTPISVLSERPKLLYTYFKQLFAQVTNPPIDPIREELVMSLVSLVGPRPNLLDLDSGGTHRRLEVSQPVLTDTDLNKIRHVGDLVGGAFLTETLDTTWDAAEGAEGMGPALERLCGEAKRAVEQGFNILILSDRAVGPDRIALPALLACSAVHHRLILEGSRTGAGLVLETGEAREVHHFCVLAGYGAEAINPYLAFETLDGLHEDGAFPAGYTREKVHKNYIKAVSKGLLKVMSKMGISTYQSYCGAQIFDAVGLASDFVDRYFTGTATTVEGASLAEVAAETVARHRAAWGDAPIYRNMLDVGGEYTYRLRGERHQWEPDSVAKLQHAARADNAASYEEYAAILNERSSRLMTLRGLFEFREDGNGVPLEEVQPAEEIVKRFATGAMSFGSISREAHTTLAIAMNRIGGKSNTGEGG